VRLIAYDLEALVRMAQQAPWHDGWLEVSAWLDDVRRNARPEGGFGRGDGGARVFDVKALDVAAARLGRLTAILGADDKPLRDLLGETPDRELEPGWTGWNVYEDLVRAWTVLVSPSWPEAALTGDEGGAALLGPLGRAIGIDLRLAPRSPMVEDIGGPYPAAWTDLPRARIHNVSTELLDHLAEISRQDVERAARETSRGAAAIAADVGRLIRHCELARQIDTVVGIDPDDAFWS
jgi:hypothetical protein